MKRKAAGIAVLVVSATVGFVSVGGVNTAYAADVAETAYAAQQASDGHVTYVVPTNQSLDTVTDVAEFAQRGDFQAAAAAAASESAKDNNSATTPNGKGKTSNVPAYTGPVPSPGTAQGVAYQMVMARGWDASQFGCLVNLWQRESGWRVNAANKSSGAYGIPQALPGAKMASAGPDWQTNPATQITWGLGYITSRYGTPCGAWGHSQSSGWY